MGIIHDYYRQLCQILCIIGINNLSIIIGSILVLSQNIVFIIVLIITIIIIIVVLIIMILITIVLILIIIIPAACPVGRSCPP